MGLQYGPSKDLLLYQIHVLWARQKYHQPEGPCSHSKSGHRGREGRQISGAVCLGALIEASECLESEFTRETLAFASRFP